MLNSLESFDIALGKFMDITNVENVANCNSNHRNDVVLLSRVMAAKACVASLAESSVNTYSQTIYDLIFFYNTFSNLSVAYSEILKLQFPDCRPTNSISFLCMKKILFHFVEYFGPLHQRWYPLFD